MTAASGLTIDILFESGNWPEPQSLERRAREMIQRVWSRQDRAEPCEVALVFAGDERVQALNNTYRHQDRPTNVLSFPAGEDWPQGAGQRPLGDIILAQETVAREAERAGITLEARMAHLVVHGFLHLLGYDHQDDSQAARMELEETLIMTEAGFGDPYRMNADV